MATSNGTGIIENITTFYNFVITDISDPRTNNWFLISSPIPWVSIVLLYLYFVLGFGPKYMKDKKPYKLTKTLMIYNLVQVAANIWLFNRAAHTWKDYNWNCQPVDFSSSPEGMYIAEACYIYFLNKIVDLADTIFFILRKKDKQVTFLHVFHHSLMVFAGWGVTKYFPGGHGTFIGLLNSFVHILVYLYYYLAAFGPEVQKYLWWKKYLTRIQLVQFFLIIVHNSQLLVTSCDYPKWTVVLTLPHAALFYYLFTDFYKKTYKQSDPKHNGTQNGTQNVIQNGTKNGTSHKVKTK